MKLKARLTIDVLIDPEDYAMPTDGNIASSLAENIQDLIHDLDGVEAKKIQVRADG